jgi:hypothetical protein
MCKRVRKNMKREGIGSKTRRNAGASERRRGAASQSKRIVLETKELRQERFSSD